MDQTQTTDLLFRLMFELFWVSPMDWRHKDDALRSFMSTANRTAQLINTPDAPSKIAQYRKKLLTNISGLRVHLEQIETSRLFDKTTCDEARRLIDQVAQQIATLNQ